MVPPRPPKRTRTQRVITVVRFEKRREPPQRRRTTRAMAQVEVDEDPSDEDTDSTAVTAPGEDTKDEQPKRSSNYLVDVPAESRGYRAERVLKLLKGQQPGQPFPTLSEGDVMELACFGRFLFEEGRLEDAQLVLEGLVASGVVDAFPYSMLGTVYLAQRDLNRALALFEAALALAPKDLAAHVYRAEIRLRQGKGELASGDLKYALRNGEPDDPFTQRAAQLSRLAKRSR